MAGIHRPLLTGGRPMLAIRLPEEIEHRLDTLARKTGRTKTYYAREAIIKHLSDLEDIYLAEKEYESVLAGKSKLTPLADVIKEYNSANKPPKGIKKK